MYKFSKKFKSVYSQLTKDRESKAANESKFNPNKMESLKESFNRLFTESFNILKTVLSKLSDDFWDGGVMNPADF